MRPDSGDLGKDESVAGGSLGADGDYWHPQAAQTPPDVNAQAGFPLLRPEKK